MNNHQCTSQNSLISIQKWLVEGGDGPLSSNCIPSSKFNHNLQEKSHLNKIIKRKKFNNQKYYPKTTSIIKWFYEFIKKIFTVYDENQLKYDKQIHNHTINDTTISTMTCSICQFENIDPNINNIQSTFKSRKYNSILHSKNNPRIMITSATSSSNLNPSQSNIFHSSKSTQTQQQSTVYPLYCFSIKDGQIFPLTLSSFSSPFYINSQKSEYCSKTIQLSNTPIDSPITYSSSHPAIASISLQTAQNLLEDDILTKIHRSSSSLYDTPICHFDKCNCLIECYHSLNTNTNAPEIVFAESTCQLIKQAWLSSTSDQQVNFQS